MALPKSMLCDMNQLHAGKVYQKGALRLLRQETSLGDDIRKYSADCLRQDLQLCRSVSGTLLNSYPFSKMLDVYIRIPTTREKGMAMSNKQVTAAKKLYDLTASLLY
jgi:hypothetical protein